MPAPPGYPNTDRIDRCVEFMLQQISNANYYYTNGAVVDRGGDPTQWLDVKEEDFRSKMVAIGIGPESEVVEPSGGGVGRTGGARRYVVRFRLMCLIRQTNEDRDAGRRLSSLVSRLIEDIKTALDSPTVDVKTIADQLAVDDPTGFPEINNAHERVSCINMHVVEVPFPILIIWPDANFDVVVEYKYDRSL